MLRDGTAVWIFRCFLRDVVMRNRLRGSRMGMVILAIMAKTLEGTYTKVHHPCNENRPSCCREGGAAAAETLQADKFGNREPGRHTFTSLIHDQSLLIRCELLAATRIETTR